MRQRKGGKMPKTLSYIKANTVDALTIHRECGSTAAYVYIVLSTVGMYHRHCGLVACMVPRDFWKEIGLEKTPWTKALRKLRKFGAIEVSGWGNDLEIIIHPVPRDCAGTTRLFERCHRGFADFDVFAGVDG